MITKKDGVWCIFSCCGRYSEFECVPEYFPLTETSLEWYKPVQGEFPMYDIVNGFAEIKKSQKQLEKEKMIALIQFCVMNEELSGYSSVHPKTAEVFLNKFLESHE